MCDIDVVGRPKNLEAGSGSSSPWPNRQWGGSYNPEVTSPASGLLPVGAQAPPFTLRRTFEETVSLDDLLNRGPAVVVFYVFDFGNI
jgi:hypothetical protein